MGIPSDAVLDVLRQLSHDIRELDIGTSVDRHGRLPVARFLRDYVAANKPVLLTGVISHWPATSKWTDEYLCEVAGDTEVTVALTPNGRADAVSPLPSSNISSSSCSRDSRSSSSTTIEGSVAGNSSWQDATSTAGDDRGCAGTEAAATPPACAKVAAQAAVADRARTSGDCFALPYQEKMPLQKFLSLLDSSKQEQAATAVLQEPPGQDCCSRDEPASAAAILPPSVVPYLQYQNSSLTAEVPQLLGDIDAELDWATEAFGAPPEAVNLWIGDNRSITSWHKDPFENIYAVVSGSKTFNLMPPADAYRMRLRRYCQATYMPRRAARSASVLKGASSNGKHEDSCCLEAVLSGKARLELVLHQPEEEVLWSSVHPEADRAAKQIATGSSPAVQATSGVAEGERDLFADPLLPPPLRVTVKAGEVLYLPAMWWHQVEQMPDETGRVIAVNYWYDMKFDARQANLLAVERLAALLGLNEEPPPNPRLAVEEQ